MGQFDFKFDASSEEARTQVQAYIDHVGDRIAEINKGEDKIMEATSLLEFVLDELPGLNENVLEARNQCKQWIDFLKEELEYAEDEARVIYGDSKEEDKDEEDDDDDDVDVTLPKDCVESLMKQLSDAALLLTSLEDARDVLKWAVEKGELEYKLKANMLDEASRFQSKYYWLENK